MGRTTIDSEILFLEVSVPIYSISELEGNLATLTISLTSCLMPPCGILYDLLEKYSKTVLQ